MQAIGRFFCGLWNRSQNWWLERGRFVLSIWSVICVIGGIYVVRIRPDDAEQLLDKMREFADPWLPTTVFLGALMAAGCASFWQRRVATSKWPEGISDELSDAATNFAAICCVLLIWQIALELLTSWQTALQQLPTELLSLRVPLGAVFVAILLCKFEPTAEPSVESQAPVEESEAREEPIDYGFEFTHPAENEEVGEWTSVTGTAKIAPPDGRELWLFRRWGGHEWECYPLTRVYLNSGSGGSTYTWNVPRSEGYVGGEQGKGQQRRFELWLVGEEGARVIRHFKKWETYINERRDEVRMLHDEVNDRRTELGVKELRAEVTLISRAIDARDIPGDMTCMAHRVVVRK
jgi:hypothetical protein